jgi:hypothetical protein
MPILDGTINLGDGTDKLVLRTDGNFISSNGVLLVLQNTENKDDSKVENTSNEKTKIRQKYNEEN